LPNYNIPLQSDITWIYRLQTNLSNQLDQSIPYGLQVTGAYDRNFIGHFIKWYQLNGRYNIADNFALKSISHIAGEDANAWRLITVIIVCLGVWIFYLIGLSLGFPKGLFFLLCLSLYLYPLDIWIDYRSTEPRAFLLLSLSILTAIRLKRYMWYVFSSALFLLAVLTKETFIIYWVLFPIILYLKKPNSLRRTLIETVPYIGAVAILSVFVLLLKINIPLLNSGYIFSNVKKEFDIFSFIFYYARQLNTGISYYFSVVLFMTFIFILIKSHIKRKYVPKE
jgi:hypothetical protein